MMRIDGFIGDTPNTAGAVSRHLAELAGDPVEVIVNSGGGDAFEGAAIFAELSAYPGRVTVNIRGIAASAASLIAMAGDVITIDQSAMFMIHDPAGMTFGPARAHRDTADTLEKLANVYATVYSARSGNPLSAVLKWMDDETWLDPDEAVALNFADNIKQGTPEMVARFDFTAFRNPPRDLVAIARENSWATERAVGA